MRPISKTRAQLQSKVHDIILQGSVSGGNATAKLGVVPAHPRSAFAKKSASEEEQALRCSTGAIRGAHCTRGRHPRLPIPHPLTTPIQRSNYT